MPEKNDELAKRESVLLARTAKASDIKCHGCGMPYDPTARPALWFPTDSVHTFTQSLVIMTYQFCCGAIHHTEPVATISSYLRDVKGNARLVCNLVNQHLLAGRPQPEWLTKAWVEWEETFQRPMTRLR